MSAATRIFDSRATGCRGRVGSPRQVVEREGFDVAPGSAATRSDVMRGDVSLHGGVGVPRQWGDNRRKAVKAEASFLLRRHHSQRGNREEGPHRQEPFQECLRVGKG